MVPINLVVVVVVVVTFVHRQKCVRCLEWKNTVASGTKLEHNKHNTSSGAEECLRKNGKPTQCECDTPEGRGKNEKTKPHSPPCRNYKWISELGYLSDFFFSFEHVFFFSFFSWF